MEKDEIKAMFKLIDSAMRVESKITDAGTLREQLNTWYYFFKDDDAASVRAALDYELTHNHFKPNIADIKSAMRKLSQTSPAELWRELELAAERGREKYDTEKCKYVSHFTNEFEKLPPILKTYIGNWRGLKEFYGTDHNTFDKKQFEKEIKELQEATEQQTMITGGEK